MSPLPVALILQAVAACVATHPAVNMKLAPEVVLHAEAESARLPWYIGVNNDQARGINHESHNFANKAEAVAFASRELADGRNLDVGIMQINLHAHPTAFASLDDALDPTRNICEGADIISQDWRVARAARCLYNTGHETCSNGYPEAVSAAGGRLLNGIEGKQIAPDLAALSDAGQPACAPNWDLWAMATCQPPSVAHPPGVQSVSFAKQGAIR